MMNDERWAELQQVEDAVYFKADLCCYLPESNSLDEKKEICIDMTSLSFARFLRPVQHLPVGIGTLVLHGYSSIAWTINSRIRITKGLISLCV